MKDTMEEYDILQCIDRALDAFGSSVKNSIFWRMSTLHNSTTSEVISDPTAFANVVHEVSNGSAHEIEASIINEMRKAFDLPASKTRNLVVALSAAKEQLTGTSFASMSGPSAMNSKS